MNGASSKLPPLKVLAAALRKTTEHLAREVVQPSDSAPQWNELEWAIARSAAAMQGISVLLANTVRWSGPQVWQSFLAEQGDQSVRREARIGELLGRIDAVTRAAGIACVGLKGAALRTLGLYRSGERPMSDIDLLVATGDVASIEAAMHAVGYEETIRVQRHRIFEPRSRPALPKSFAEHVDNPLKIEVHTAVTASLPIRPVDITARLRTAHEAAGLNPYPSVAALMLHLLLHAAGDMRAHALRQIRLHDIAMLASRLSDNDWGALLEPPAAERSWWAFPPLALVARYYPDSLPREVLRESRNLCPRVLRFSAERHHLTDVSWSNLRIHAFPGIEWSRTPLDAVRFMRSRALPSPSALAELPLLLQAEPQLGQIRWYGITHGERIVRWLFSRPPRVQTMMSVRAALGSLDPR